MMPSPDAAQGTYSETELSAYLDEMLPVERAAAIEAAVRTSPDLQRQLAQILRRRDQGGHTVGEIWRRHQLSCPSRSELGSYVLGVADEGEEDYIEFHLRSIGCRVCQSNLEDLQAAQEQPAKTSERTKRFFESSAGVLRTRRNT